MKIRRFSTRENSNNEGQIITKLIRLSEKITLTPVQRLSYETN